MSDALDPSAAQPCARVFFIFISPDNPGSYRSEEGYGKEYHPRGDH